MRPSLVIMLIALTWTASGQTLGVAYLDGDAALSRGASWVKLAIGDTVPQNATLQVGKDSYLELKSADATIILSRTGTYSVHDLLSASLALKAAGAGKALSASLARLFSGPTHNDSGVLGARGANESKSEDSGWVESSTQVFLEAGKTFIASGKYEKAIDQFRQALDTATEEESSEVRFDLAYAYSLSGNTREALGQIAGLESKGSEAWAIEFALLKAKLLVDTNAFAEEIAWLTQGGNDLSRDAQRAPMYYFLLGVGYRGVGDTSHEKQSLSRVVTTSGESDLRKAATQLLQNP
jgi:tetratricopeptide (TPR) repeat protein